MSVDAARDVIAQGVADVITHANAESLPSDSIRFWYDTWLNTKSIEAKPSTHARYKRIVERFPEFIGSKAKRDLSTLQASELSFHSLRHSAVTMLKASRLSDVFAREIVGPESAAVSRQYAHLSTDDLRKAMQRLPDVTGQ